MDLGKVVMVLLTPLAINVVQCMFNPKNKTHCNSFVVFSNYSLYSVLAVVLSYMAIMKFKEVVFKDITVFEEQVKMGGLEFIILFIFFTASLIIMNYFTIELVKKKWIRNSVSIFLLSLALIVSVIIIYHEQIFKIEYL